MSFILNLKHAHLLAGTTAIPITMARTISITVVIVIKDDRKKNENNDDDHDAIDDDHDDDSKICREKWKKFTEIPMFPFFCSIYN